ncbi:NAD(P)-dependent alcohol dehydrogenase [uncultured Sulfitobacter sp.]|uniref:NAD(P)-dependent alcohol dehydrogenase n=1 Tax=uncultured Sulfitobacter sp. TaxID=191468 RepID=UPI00261187B8|nr:NAD(P)-dependent alcohol dehydrogenase [uncultured Sulfitobacter sp.]
MPKGLGLLGRLVFGISGPRKPILGTEFSGVIKAVGANVTHYQTSDAVIGFPGASFGAHAEFITMPADGKLTLKPDNISFEHAATIPFGATTAYDFLVNKAKLQRGETVLINGASGSVGSACVQIAKHLGAHVTAVCSGRNAEMVRTLGADRVIDYRTQEVIETNIQYDVVVDTVGTLPWAQAKHAIRNGGKMVLIAGKTSDMFLGGMKARLAGKKMVGGVASERRDILEAVVELAALGVLRPVIDRSYTFDDMKTAHAHVDTGHKKGNVVVTVKSHGRERSPIEKER